MTATRPVMKFVSDSGLLDAMAALGFDFGFMCQMSIGVNDTGRGYATLTDWRKLGSPYKTNWVGSVYDKDGEETHRFIVPRQ